MTNTKHDETFVPWYKVGFFWFAMAPLAGVMIVTLGFLIPAALTDRDGSVADDVYRSYRGYDVRRDHDELARDMGLSAIIQRDGEALVIDVKGLDNSWPPQLRLELIFPTREANDREFVLVHVNNGRYRSGPILEMTGRRYAFLKPVTQDSLWRLRGEIMLPFDGEAELLPRVY
ncbi:FixH family protein [Salinispirillum sp. LH 10-3-1]|uniref:FixH family protein n=1 Tax=Salinispirillum sp. LH 10-3-1 TaxID=2952525 RepID=A0AB38YD93_9GAMM